MKKAILILGIIGGFTACEKCHDCHYDSPAGEIEIGEYCGDDLEAIENSGYSVGETVYTVHCEEH